MDHPNTVVNSKFIIHRGDTFLVGCMDEESAEWVCDIVTGWNLEDKVLKGWTVKALQEYNSLKKMLVMVPEPPVSTTPEDLLKFIVRYNGLPGSCGYITHKPFKNHMGYYIVCSCLLYTSPSPRDRG